MPYKSLEKRREAVRSSMAKSRAENRESYNEKMRLYYAEHPAYFKQKSRAYQAKRVGATIGKIDFAALKKAWDGTCGICHLEIVGPIHLDHIIPLSKGGAHVTSNLQFTHPACNLSKGGKIL